MNWSLLSVSSSLLPDGDPLDAILLRLAPLVRGMSPDVRNFLADLVLRLPSGPLVLPTRFFTQARLFVALLQRIRVQDMAALSRAVADLLLVPDSLAFDARHATPPKPLQVSQPAFIADEHQESGSSALQISQRLWVPHPRRTDSISHTTPFQVASDATLAVRGSAPAMGGGELLSPSLDPRVLLSPSLLLAGRLPMPTVRLDGIDALGLVLPTDTLQVGPRKVVHSNDFRTRFGWIGKVEDLMSSYSRPYLLRLDLVRLGHSEVINSRATPSPLLTADASSLVLAQQAASPSFLKPPLALPSSEKHLTSDALPTIQYASDFFESASHDHPEAVSGEVLSVAPIL